MSNSNPASLYTPRRITSLPSVGPIRSRSSSPYDASGRPKESNEHLSTELMSKYTFSTILHPDLAEDMKEIEDSTGMSRAEIFRRAIALYKRAKQTEKSKGNVILRNSDGTLREVIGF